MKKRGEKEGDIKQHPRGQKALLCVRREKERKRERERRHHQDDDDQEECIPKRIHA